MSYAARVAIAADRYTPCVRTITFRGLDLTGVTLRMQWRLAADTPGAPLVDLQNVTNAQAQGLKLVSVETTDGYPVSTVQMRVNETTVKGLPYAGELGDATALVYDLIGTLGGDKRVLMAGTVTIGAGVTGADNAPLNRPFGYSSHASGGGGMRNGATLTFGETTIDITIDGADLIAPLRADALAARDDAQEANAAAQLAAATALASSRYFPSRAAGEAASAADQLFSTDDGAGSLIYYRRTAGGSTEIGRALTPARLAAPAGATLVGFNPAGDGAVSRDVATKLREIIVTLTDYGAVMNVDNAAAAAANDLAIKRAFAASSKVWATGGRTDFYVFAESPQIPDDGILMGDGATFQLRGEGMRAGQRSKSRWISYVGILPPVPVGTPGSGVPPRQSATPNSPQYALYYMNGKSGCEALIPYMANGPINGVQANNGSFNHIEIEQAENFGSDGVFHPTEGAIVYAPALEDSSIHIGNGTGTYGGGSIILFAPKGITIKGSLHDTRRAAISSAGVPGSGNKLDRLRIRRTGSLTPVVDNPPWNHWQSTLAIFVPNTPRQDFVQVISPDIEDWGETLIEGTMKITNLRAKVNPGYDAAMKSPNPGALYGRLDVEGGVLQGYRGRGFSAGGETGLSVTDVRVEGLQFLDPRPTQSRPVPQGPDDSAIEANFVHIQPDGSGAVGDNINVRSNVGYDSTGNVQTAFEIGPTGGATFTSNCTVSYNQSSKNVVSINGKVNQYGNSWQMRQGYIAEPSVVQLRDALVSAGIMRPPA